METQIEEQYSILEGIIEGTDSPIYSVDTEYCYTSFNKTHAAVMKSLYGVDIEIGKSLLKYQTVEEDRVMSKRSLDRVLSGNPVVEEVFFGEEGLSRRYYELLRNPIRSAGGQVVGVAVLARDVTETKKAEDALRRTQFTVDQSGDSVFWLTPDAKILYANDESCRRLGYTRMEISSLSMFDINVDFAADPGIWEKVCNRLRESGHFISEFRHRTKGGEVFSVEATLNRFEFEGDEIFVANLRDIAERKKAEEAVRESEAKLKIAQEMGRIGSWEFDIENQEITWSDESYRLYERDPALGPPTVDEEATYYSPEQVLELREYARRATEEGKDFKYDLEATFPSGRHAFYSATMQPIKDDRGGVVKLFGTVQDITKRKQVEDVLAESERRYRELFDEAPVSIWEQDFSEVKALIEDLKSKGVTDFGKCFDENPELLEECVAKIKVTNVNEATLRMFKGKTKDPFLEGIGVVLTDNTYTTLKHEMVTFAEGNTRFEEEVEYITNEGEIIQGLVRVSIPEAYLGDWSRVLVSITDITKRKQAEAKLQEAEKKYRELAETLPQVVFETDNSGKITYVNKKAFEIFGYTEEDVEKGVNALQVIDPVDHERVAGAMQKMMDGRSTGAVREYLARRKDGTTFPAVVYSTLIADTDGKAIGIRGILTDITERKRYEEQLERVNAELKGFAHTISHDLRGPLAALMGANKTLQLLLRDPDVEDFRSDIREMTEIIDSCTARAEKLITDVLSLAETAQVPQEVSDVAVREVVGKIIEEKAADIEEREIDVRVENNLGIVVANPTHVYQVFANLIGDAIKHNDSDNPVIEISHSGDEEKGVHRYLIRDNGSGIPADILDSVFNPFIKGKGGSSGVGLAIVKKIVEVYGGDISAYNDNGACFELTLKDYEE